MLPEAARVQIDSHLDDRDERRLADDVLDGFTRPFKELPPKHFYDTRGSELFEQICNLPEYYPTRTEMVILRTRADEIIATTGAGELVELGSGATTKARLLLDPMAANGGAHRYVPFDVAEVCIRTAADELTQAFPGMVVHGVVGDFERHLDRVPARVPGVARLVALLGGTVGNFPPGTRRRLLRDIGRTLGPDDHLLLGTDLVKEPAVLEAAYDDSAGVTAEFNRNVLRVINRELDGDFDPDAFDHVAFFDREQEWIEMRLRARRPLRARVEQLDLDVTFAEGEEMRTEISAKFTRRRVEDDLAAAGLELRAWLTDPEGLFALSLAAPRA